MDSWVDMGVGIGTSKPSYSLQRSSRTVVGGPDLLTSYSDLLRVDIAFEVRYTKPLRNAAEQ